MLFKVRFIGTQQSETIEAENMLTAKWIFAGRNGIASITRIQASKVNSDSKA